MTADSAGSVVEVELWQPRLIQDQRGLSQPVTSRPPLYPAQPTVERVNELDVAVDQILRSGIVAFVRIPGETAHRLDPHRLKSSVSEAKSA